MIHAELPVQNNLLNSRLTQICSPRIVVMKKLLALVHMCGPAAQGSHPTLPDTRVQAEAVVQFQVGKHSSD